MRLSEPDNSQNVQITDFQNHIYLFQHYLSILQFMFIKFLKLMLGISLTSQNFSRLLFKTETDLLSTKVVIPTVLTPLNNQTSKKNTIVIISNGKEQVQNKPKRKKYVFSDDQIEEQSSEMIHYSRQKRHLIKKEKKQDPDYSVKRQKNDRNVVSNIVHHLMRHVLTSISDEQLNSIILKKQIKLSKQRFLRVLQEKQKLCKTYITNKHLKQLWNDSKQPQYSKLMRIVSRIFLQNYSFLTIFNGNKLNKESKAIHYKGRRQLLQFFSKLK